MDPVRAVLLFTFSQMLIIRANFFIILLSGEKQIIGERS